MLLSQGHTLVLGVQVVSDQMSRPLDNSWSSTASNVIVLSADNIAGFSDICIKECYISCVVSSSHGGSAMLWFCQYPYMYTDGSMSARRFTKGPAAFSTTHCYTLSSPFLVHGTLLPHVRGCKHVSAIQTYLHNTLEHAVCLYIGSSKIKPRNVTG